MVLTMMLCSSFLDRNAKNVTALLDATENGELPTTEAAVNSGKHEKFIEESWCYFVECLEKHDKLKFLAKEVTREDGSKELNLFQVCGGVKTTQKKSVLNSVMLHYSTRLVKKEFRDTDLSTASAAEKAAAQYQPKTVRNYLNGIFRILHEHGIQFSQLHDFNGKGGFGAYWKDLWDSTTNERPGFGTLPNRGKFDQDEEYKIRVEASPPFRPYDPNHPMDLLYLLLFFLSKRFALRASEVSVCLCCFLNLKLTIFFTELEDAYLPAEATTRI